MSDIDFTRDELWVLEARARRRSDEVLNESWKRAYADLAYACSVLDAHFARSAVSMPLPNDPPQEARPTAGARP